MLIKTVVRKKLLSVFTEAEKRLGKGLFLPRVGWTYVEKRMI